MMNGSPTTFALDGIPVTRDMFMAHLMPMLNLYGGGMFGMMEISKRMSMLPKRKVGEWWQTTTERSINTGGGMTVFDADENITDQSMWNDDISVTGISRQFLGNAYEDVSWAINSTILTLFQQAQTRDGKTNNLRNNLEKDFKSFLKANPNCKKALKGFGINIKKLFKAGVFTDVTQNPSDLNKTIRDLGANSIDLSERDLNTTLEKTLGDGIAAALVGTNKIYMGANYSAEINSIERGRTIVHELLHIFFKTGHVKVAKGLGLDIDHNFVDIERTVTPGRLEGGKWIKRVTETRRIDLNDEPAAALINDWLRNNCGKK